MKGGGGGYGGGGSVGFALCYGGKLVSQWAGRAEKRNDEKGQEKSKVKNGEARRSRSAELSCKWKVG